MSNTKITTTNGEVVVTVAGAIIMKGYLPLVTAKQVASFVNQPVYYKQEHKTYKIAGDILGASCSKIATAINAAMCECYIDPMKKFIGRFGFLFREKQQKAITMIVQNREAIKAAESNMAGYAMLFGYEAKSKLGLIWKELTNNSKSRNDLIAVLTTTASEDHGIVVKNLNKIPTTILRKYGTSYHSVMADMLLHINKPLYKINCQDINYGILRMTVKNQINTYSPLWTKKSIIRRYRTLYKRQFNMKKKYAQIS